MPSQNRKLLFRQGVSEIVGGEREHSALCPGSLPEGRNRVRSGYRRHGILFGTERPRIVGSDVATETTGPRRKVLFRRRLCASSPRFARRKAWNPRGFLTEISSERFPAEGDAWCCRSHVMYRHGVQVAETRARPSSGLEKGTVPAGRRRPGGSSPSPGLGNRFPLPGSAPDF